MSHYTFKERCSSCDGVPVYTGHGMCDVCCNGEADSTWEWIECINGDELDAAVDYIFKEVLVEPLVDKMGNIDPLAAAIMHINQGVLDEIEKLIDRWEILHKETA